MAPTTTFIDTRIVLGGPGKIVQIDKSLFRHKPKASSSSAISIAYLHHKIATCLYSITVGNPHTNRRVFGMVDASVCPGLGYMEVVTARDARTLLPIIHAHTAPGTTIYSDEWRDYSTVSTIPAVAHT